MNCLNRLPLVGCIVFLLPMVTAPRTFGQADKVDRSAFKDFALSPEIMTSAASQTLAFRGGNKMQNGPQKEAYGIYLDALVTCLNPETKTADGKLLKDVLLAQVRNLLVGGHEPNAACGLDGWTHGTIAQVFLLVKKTPEVWSQLTADEKSRMDWIMKAMAVAGHFGYDDGNNYNTSLHADDNSYKKWNPNHRLYLLVVLSAADYFGPKELDEIFTSFSYDEYLKKFDEYGFANIKAVWTCYDWKPILENGGPYISPKTKKQMGTGTGVKHPFTYDKIPLANIAEIYCSVAEYCYSKTVTNGIEGESWILNKGSSPFLGQPGMIMEFQTHDAEGNRSSLSYCNEDFCAYTTMMMTLKVVGHWPADNERCRKVEKLMYVGNEDFLYKNATGFHSFAHGKGKDDEKLENGKWLGFPYVVELWNKYLKDNLKPQEAGAAK